MQCTEKTTQNKFNLYLFYNEDKYKDDDLNGCVNDLNNLKKFLKEKGDFLDEDIITLVNNEATKEVIEMEILNLKMWIF